MGCVSSTSNSPAAPPRVDKERSYAIDKQLEDDAKRFRRECKILLLGTRLYFISFHHCLRDGQVQMEIEVRFGTSN